METVLFAMMGAAALVVLIVVALLLVELSGRVKRLEVSEADALATMEALAALVASIAPRDERAS